MRIITSEQVSAGHPDKICDQIADAIVTDCLRHDRNSRVAIECLFKNRCLVIAGELTSTHEPDYKKLVQDVFDRINNGGAENENAGLDYKLDISAENLDITILVDRQSNDIALGVNTGGARDQGMVYGYATNETPEMLPIPFVLATRFLELLKAYPCRMLKADAKAQVSFDYDSGRITTFLCSVQHTPDVEVEDFREIIESLMVRTATEYGLNTDFEKLVNPTGRFVLGSSYADCGVTGRKLACDTYGGIGHIGGGAMCVDSDTEFLTPNGWKSIADYKTGDMVGQWNGGKLEFVIPNAFYVNQAKNMLHIRSDEVLDMVLSDMHDVVLETQKGNIIKKQARFLFDENGVKNGNHGFIPTSFMYTNNNEGLKLSDGLIRIQVAFCADGTILPPKKGWTGRLRVKRQHKKIRIRYLLNENGIRYKETADGDFSIFWFDPPFLSKKMSDCLRQANSRQLSIIADECQLWDGSKNTFRTTHKDEADFIQFAFMTAYQTNATISESDRVGEKYTRNGKEYIRKSVMYRVYATKWKKHQIKYGINGTGHCVCTPFIPNDGKMYCFSVPSGILVLRRNNRVFVTGNCGKDPTKVDRSGAYAARKIARDIVSAGYADKAEVQIAYAIGVAEPVSVYAETFGTEHQDMEFISQYVRENYDLTPRGIIEDLHLLDVDYNKVSAYGHFGKQGLPWEQ